MVANGYAERPDYRVDLLPRRNRMVARIDDRVLADTVASLVVDEQDHGLVVYFPESDVRFDELAPIDRTTVCPYKGEANYWRLRDGEDSVAWTYRSPHPQVVQLKGYVGFYQDRVSVEIGVANPAVVGYST